MRTDKRDPTTMEKPLHHKCRPTVGGEGIVGCPQMERALDQEPNARRRGLSVIVLTKIPAGDDAKMYERCIGVAYKASARDRGVLLNQCPWCGAVLLFDEKVREQAGVTQLPEPAAKEEV